MKYISSLTIILSVIFLINTENISAQNTGSVKGTVSDKSTKEPLELVEIYIEGTGNGTITDQQGWFNIKDIPEGNHTIRFYLMGYTTAKRQDVEIKTGKTTNLNISLQKNIVQMNEVTVSAAKISKTVKKIGSPVYIIDRREIERTEGRNIEEAMVKIPGVFTEDRFHNESNVISFRGIGLHTHVTRGILVLVDGVSITEAMGRTDFEGVDMANAQKIEVIKGPVSAMYGPNGITGVINIVEQTPADGMHGKIEASLGSYNTKSIGGNINGGKNGFKYKIKGRYYASDGYQDRSNYSSARGGAKISKTFNKYGKIEFTGDYIHSDANFPGPLDSLMFAERSTISTNKFTGNEKDFYRLNLRYVKQWGRNSELTANLYNRNRKTEGHYSDSFFANDNIGTWGAEIRNKFSYSLFGNPGKLIIGISADRENGESELFSRDDSTGIVGEMIDQGKSIYDLVGLYVEEEYTLFNKLAITLGLRYDYIRYNWNDEFNTGQQNTSDKTSLSAISPKLGFTYNPTERLTIFGNLARGFNPPQISQLFVGSSYSGLPNPDLEPEFLTNYELGARGGIGEMVFYQVSAFLMDFENQISAEIDPDVNPDVPVYQNIGNTRHQGIEASLELRASENLNIYANYSYLDARFVSNPEYGDNMLRKTPKNQINAGIRYDFSFGLCAMLDYRFMSEYYMDNLETNTYSGHSLVNAKLMYKYQGLVASFAINNLLDANYATWAYASKSYNPMTHQTSWEQMYYPGWPVNFNISLGYKFDISK